MVRHALLGGAEMSTPENGSNVRKRTQVGQVGYELRLELGQVARNITRRKTIGRVACLVVGFSEHPNWLSGKIVYDYFPESVPYGVRR